MMGSGTDVARESADVVLPLAHLRALPQRISGREVIP